MKKQKLAKCVAFGFAAAFYIVAFAPCVSAQTVFYVSPTGSDSASGTIGAPVRTIARARDLVRNLNSNMSADITVYLRGGIYRLDTTVVFNTADGGTNGFKVIYKAYPGEKPVISGGVPVTGWTNVSGSLWRAPFSYNKKLRSLYVNNHYRIMAEGSLVQGQGGSGTFNISGTEPWAFNSGSVSAGIKFNTSDFGLYKNPHDIELVSEQSTWTRQRVCVDTIYNDGNNITAKMQEPGFAFSQSLAFQCNRGPNVKWKAVNCFELLKTPGQFYYDRSGHWLYYICKSNENMTTAEVIAPTVEKLINIAGTSTTSRVQNIVFDSLTFMNNNYLLPGNGLLGVVVIQSTAVTVKYCNDGNWHPWKYNTNSVLGGAIELYSAQGISFVNNNFLNLTGIALSLVNDATNCRIEGNRFVDISASAINIGHPQHYAIGDGEIFGNGIEGACNGTIIRNNMIRNVSYEHISSPGIGAYFVANTNLCHNDQDGTPYSGISFGWWWGDAGIPPSTVMEKNHIDSNKISNAMNVLIDGGLIYTLGYSPNSTVQGNYLLNSKWNGIHPDDGTSYVSFLENVIEKAPNKWIELYSENSYNNTVKYNFANTNSSTLNGINSTISDNTIDLTAPPWKSQTALNIIAHAGLEQGFQRLLDTTGLYKMPLVGIVHNPMLKVSASKSRMSITVVNTVQGMPCTFASKADMSAIKVYDLSGRLVWMGESKDFGAAVEKTIKRKYGILIVVKKVNSAITY